MNRRVSVWNYVRIGKKWRYCKPDVEKNGKIKSHWVIVKGKEEPGRQLHEQYKKIPANQLITLREGSGIISNKGWARA